jgi:catechol 2,3-dioxygenase-like lactoylglutathione lyase family enzyme
MIKGVNHITLSVKDVEESFTFYTAVLGCRPVARWPQGAYLMAGDVWLALVLDDQARQEALPEYSHIAFTVSLRDLACINERLAKSGVKIWQQNWTEGDSLYFIDPNGHKLEIHATDLGTRLQTARIDPWPGLEFFDR